MTTRPTIDENALLEAWRDGRERFERLPTDHKRNLMRRPNDLMDIAARTYKTDAESEVWAAGFLGAKRRFDNDDTGE